MRPWASNPHILVFDPPPARLARVTEALTRKGCRVSRCDSAEGAIVLLSATAAAPSADLLLICQAEPAAALDLVARVRRASLVPIVVQGGAPAGSRERVAALELGADDHIDSQMALPEVLARIQAVLRRAGWTGARPAARPPVHEAAPSPAIQGGWRLVPHRRALVRIQGGAQGNESVPLTGAEFELLRLLAAAQGEPVDREAISRVVFRRPWQLEDRAVDGLVKRLRRKLPADAIAAVRGVGYALRFAEATTAAESGVFVSADTTMTSVPHQKVENCVQTATVTTVGMQSAVGD